MQLLFLPSWLPEEMLKALCWTLVHSLWQGALAAVLAGIIILSTRKSAARVRYNWLGSILIFFVITAAITFYYQLRQNTMAKQAVSPVAVTETIAGDVPAGNELRQVNHENFTDTIVTYFNTHADLFVLTWAVFFLIHCIKITTGLAGVQRIRYRKTHASPVWQAKLLELSQALGITKSVRLLQSELVKVPVAVGFLKPVILVPLGLLSQLPPGQVETILLHELAHIRRRDYLVNLLQCMAEAVFFFNPALLWISSLLRQEREACCDDIVVANTTDKGSYLEALVSFQEYSLSPAAYAMAIGSKRFYLLNRVKRMVTRENKKLNFMEKSLLLFGVAAMTAFTFIPQKEKPAPARQSIEVTVNEPALELPPVVVLPKPIPSIVQKPAGKPEKRYLTPVTVPVADTVPSGKNSNYDELKFPSVSSTMNHDGANTTETATLTDQYGKKYSVTKLNNKITSFTIDGNPVPENEINNYAPLLQKISQTVGDGRHKRDEKQKERKEREKERKQREKERQIQIKEKHEQVKEKNKQAQDKKIQIKEKHRQVIEKNKEIQEKNKQIREEKRQLIEQNRKVSERNWQIKDTNDWRIKDKRVTANKTTTVNTNVNVAVRIDSLRIVNSQSLRIESRNLQFNKNSKLNISIDSMKFDMKIKTDLNLPQNSRNPALPASTRTPAKSA